MVGGSVVERLWAFNTFTSQIFSVVTVVKTDKQIVFFFSLAANL